MPRRANYTVFLQMFDFLYCSTDLNGYLRNISHMNNSVALFTWVVFLMSEPAEEIWRRLMERIMEKII